MRRTPTVFLVGAGPGDPGLVTLKGREALRRAEVVVYDWLVNRKLLELAPQAEKIFAGKKGGVHFKEQGEIHRILLRNARQGKSVVRLKGGDPFIFGRGGEEAGFLARHRVPFEVIPGVSAGIGVPAYAGIPLTDRRFASQVTFVTGHEQEERRGAPRGRPTVSRAGTRPAPTTKVDWKKLAPLNGTIVSFMGVKNLSQHIRGLIDGGKSPQTPVAVIEWGTLPHQRVVTGTLRDIVQKCRRVRIGSPALTIIGEVVRLRRQLDWFRKRPLLGKTILVTRARTQASELVERLSERGARVLEFPTIEILAPSRPGRIDREIHRLSQYDWIVFTSANGVHFFFERLRRLAKDSRALSENRVAAIGEKTAQALETQGVRADLVPREFTSEALFRSLKKAGEIRGKKFLLARADIAPPDLRKALRKEGAMVVEIQTYRTRPVGAPLVGARQSRGQAQGLPLQLLKSGKIDYVTFTSSSTVKNFFEPIPVKLRKRIRARFVTIGPVTSRALRGYGFEPIREARVHTIEGLVETICNGR